MNLNDMSAQHSSKTGEALGFGLKSKKSGKLFVAIARAITGKFVIQDQSDKKAIFTVSGSEDRYTFAPGGVSAVATSAAKKVSPAVAMNEKLTTLRSQASSLETQMETLETQLENVNEEISTLEDEIDALEGYED